jgi:hypothetical protein
MGMRRWLLALGVVLALSTASTYADYVIITINLSSTKDAPDDSTQPGGMPGAPGRGGFPGMQMPGGGMPGMMPGMQMPGQQGRGGGRNPGMGMQQGGGRGSGKGGPGMGGPQGPGGMPGLPGMQGGGPGGFGQGMRGGQFSSKTSGKEGEEDDNDPNAVIVTATVEVDHAVLKHNPNTGHYHIITKYGETELYYRPDEIKVEVVTMATTAQRFAVRRKEIRDDASTSDKIEQLRALAVWALEHGLLQKVDETMEEIEKLDPKNSTVKAFLKTRVEVEREATKDDAALRWRDRLGDYQPLTSKHYALLYNGKAHETAQARLDRLEQNYRGFFYWFALNNHPLPVPTSRLVAVLVDSPETFRHGHKDIFDETLRVGDGFFSARENIVVLASSRLDDAYDALTRLAREYWKTWPMEDLLKKKKKLRDGKSAEDLYRAETFTLVWKAMAEESQRAAVTGEATKQLLVATGLWPRNVEVPHWLNFGMGSFFETPPGAFWPGVGGLNSLYHKNFKKWDSDRKSKLEHDPFTALKGVVTDAYFRKIALIPEPKPVRVASTSTGPTIEDEERKERDDEIARARTLTWAFTYYLMHNKLDGMLRYFQELSQLPRDLDVDGDALMLLFAKAFGLTVRDNPNQIDENQVGNLARIGYTYVRDFDLQQKDAQKDKETDSETPKPINRKRR